MAHGTCYGVDLRHVVQHIPSILLMRTCTTSQVWSFLTHLHVQEATVVFRIHFVVDENAPLRSRSFVQHLRTQVTCFFFGLLLHARNSDSTVKSKRQFATATSSTTLVLFWSMPTNRCQGVASVAGRGVALSLRMVRGVAFLFSFPSAI